MPHSGQWIAPPSGFRREPDYCFRRADCSENFRTLTRSGSEGGFAQALPSRLQSLDLHHHQPTQFHQLYDLTDRA